MTHKLIGAIALLALSACGQQQSADSTADTGAGELVSGLAIENMDTTVHPGDDFFMYMNGAWIANTEIPADKATYGGFVMLRDESEDQVKAIIEESATGDFPKGSDEQKVGDLYRSYMDWDSRNAKGVDPLQPELDRIAAIDDHAALAAYFGGALRRGLDAPIGITFFADLKRPTHYGAYLFQSGLGLPDREFYFNDDDKSVEIRQEYVQTHRGDVRPRRPAGWRRMRRKRSWSSRPGWPSRT